ncbi:tumor suppressor candidate 3 [Eurytemora carolleeae]|uniref:tumor suppressor candidate 3 n=1 Tax=Eurytemora carolleeae TaxID=1294199 RepID=UPI000C7576C6|nr:tumor suppressor candidate 3 [Eurytemora carolleeae]|eukprot:XP_023336658.1 tumor suppressor candidate 3-like [Eurytemora affinis]
MIFPPLLLFLLLQSSLGQEGKNKLSTASAGLQERMEKLLELSSRRAVIKLNNKLFKDLVKSSPRNYSVVVMFTALSSSRYTFLKPSCSQLSPVVGIHFSYLHVHSSLQ